MASTLIVVQGSCLPLGSLQALIAQHNITQDSADITTDPASCTTTGYGKALLVLSHADPAVLGAVCRILKPGAEAVLHLPRMEQVGQQYSHAAPCCLDGVEQPCLF